MVVRPPKGLKRTLNGTESEEKPDFHEFCNPLLGLFHLKFRLLRVERLYLAVFTTLRGGGLELNFVIFMTLSGIWKVQKRDPQG